MPTTAQTASLLTGDKLYQVRARAALPLLVRQAAKAKPISYSTLAKKLKMPNPRNLNFVLGCIGQTIEHLSKQFGTKVPQIQCLVVNKTSGMPGKGIDGFLGIWDDHGNMPPRSRREIVNKKLMEIYRYPHWDVVLDSLKLAPVAIDFTDEIELALSGLGGGESQEHKRLKEFVARNPTAIGLFNITSVGETEYRLHSGDCLDISFRSNSSWVAVEVKSRVSDDADLVRGIFQCVKYQAILNAVLLSKSMTIDARVVLVLEEKLPDYLLPLCNLLRVAVVDEVRPR